VAGVGEQRSRFVGKERTGDPNREDTKNRLLPLPVTKPNIECAFRNQHCEPKKKSVRKTPNHSGFGVLLCRFSR
jgi:hypothetical protein